MIRQARFKFCPHCAGTKIEPLQENAIRCADCGYVLFLNCAAAVAGIVETIGGILLVRRSASPKRGYFDLPGGFVNNGESLESALKREIREELNIEVTDLRYFASFPNTYLYRRVTYFTADAFFICRLSDPRSLRAQEEIAEVMILKPEKIFLEKIAFASTRQVFRKYVNEIVS